MTALALLALHTCYTQPRLYIAHDGTRTLERDWYMASTCDAGDDALSVSITPRLSGWTVSVTRDDTGAVVRTFKLPTDARIADAWRWAVTRVHE